MNYKLIAIQVGDLIKYASTANEINRAASSVFGFQRQNFPQEEGVTSARASLFHDWVMTLAKQHMGNNDRNALLIQFCKNVVPENLYPDAEKILKDGGVIAGEDFSSGIEEFMQRNLHAEIHKHCKKLYLGGHYFHAVFEACKVYNKRVKDKAQETKDGHALMMAVWEPKGVLKVTPCQSETDHNVQNGIKFLSAGLMQAVRNPTAHEPADEWPISKKDCLNILSFLSFLFEKLDQAVYYPVET